MKKLFFIFAAISMLSMASCKKDYTCTCSATVNGITNTDVEIIPNASKPQAATICKGGEVYGSGNSVRTTCTLN